MNNKAVVIVGTTASGKTKLGVQLAKKFNGEIVSADSRQVYRGMDVGSGKDLKEYVIKKSEIRNQKSVSIPYHLIDIASPNKQVTVADWQKLAYTAIDDILQRGKLPIVAGGTGLYISALMEGYVLPQARITKHGSRNLRKKLNKLSLARLLKKLEKIDSKTYSIIDKNNRVRVQRALEIFYETGITKSAQLKKQQPKYQFLILGLTLSKDQLKLKITKRLKQRVDQEGMVAEVKKLHRQGVSWKKLESFGLEYRYVALYLQGKLKYDAMVEQLDKAIVDFTKRQMTWFKRDKKIKWIKPTQAAKLVQKFVR